MTESGSPNRSGGDATGAKLGGDGSQILFVPAHLANKVVAASLVDFENDPDEERFGSLCKTVWHSVVERGGFGPWFRRAPGERAAAKTKSILLATGTAGGLDDDVCRQVIAQHLPGSRDYRPATALSSRNLAFERHVKDLAVSANEDSSTGPADDARVTKKCPWCAEEILAEAKKCKHCGELLTDGQPGRPVPTPAASPVGNGTAVGPGVVVAVVLVIIALVVGLVVVASGGGQDGWPEDEREANEWVCRRYSGPPLNQDYDICMDEAYQEWQREQG